MPAQNLVTFLSDFGTDDVYVGLCHIALAAAAPGARVVDLTHAVPPQDVSVGAARLADAVRYTPVAVHLAVVDPGVGSRRRGVALRAARGDWLVGPDNGLLAEAAQELGGVEEAWELAVAAGASPTFHGRDVFAPAAGRLAADASEPHGDAVRIDPADLAALPPTAARRTGEHVEIAVRDVDRFGDVQLAARPDDPAAAGLAGEVILPPGERARRVRTFSDLEPAGLGVVVDGLGWLAVVRRDGDAAALLSVCPGDRLLLRPVPTGGPAERQGGGPRRQGDQTG